MTLRRLAVGVALASGLLLLAAGLWTRRLARGPGFPSGQVRVAGLAAPVTVLRDSLGIPHIWAGSAPDLHFAQGWLTASDRLWQMELLRTVAAGRLSEIFGPATLDTDRFLRTLGMRRAAEAGVAVLGEEERGVLGAYVAGVNAAIDSWTGPLPPEFLILGVEPEPWTLADALSLEKVMAWDLAEYEESLSQTEAHARLGPEAFRRIAPGYPEWAPTIVDGWPEGGRERLLYAERARPGAPVRPDSSSPLASRESSPESPASPGGSGPPEASALVRLAELARPPSGARRFLELGAAAVASNSWVVGPGASRSGKPLLANDMHLALNQPTLWYLVGLHGPGVDVVGMSLPGAPGVIAGHTAGVAWGFTNAYVDDADLFLERVDPSDSTRYLTPEGTRPFEVREEVVRVKGQAPDTVHVRATRHGPIITPVEARAGGHLMALRWAALDPSRSTRAFIRLNRARSAEDVVAALPDFTNPHQNVVFADTAGAWGYWMAGRVPLRRSGRPPVLPVPGWTGEHDWVGDLPFADHPHAVVPAGSSRSEEFIVTANNRQSGDTVSDLITNGTWADPYRAIRIRERIEQGGPHDAASMLAIQLDVESTFARRHLPTAVDAFRAAGLLEEADTLAAWNTRAERESRASTLFHRWIRALLTLEKGRLYDSPGGYYPEKTLDRHLSSGTIPADRTAAAARVSVDAEGAVAPWGEVHRLTIDHPLAGVVLLARVLGFGRNGIPRAGTPHTPNVGRFTGNVPPFVVTHGPSQRHVVDLADPDGAGGFILPGGQSGYPRSPHAWDQFDRWEEGVLVPLPLARASVEARTTVRLTLVPLEPR